MVTVPDEVRERLLSYISHQAAKEPEAIRDVVQRGQDQVRGLLDGLSDEQAAFKPSDDDWSVLEVLRHVVGSKRGVARRCAVLARGEASTSFEPDDEVGPFSSMAEARAALEEAHDAMVAFISTLSQRTNVEARHEHPVLGPLNCREWAVFQRVHHGDHAGQIEQIKAASGFPS